MVTHVNGTAKAAEEAKNRARAQAGIAIQAATGLNGLAALTAVDVCMRTLQRFGLVTVGSEELERVGQTVDKMQFALVQAYVAIDALDGTEQAKILDLIESVLGGKPRKVTDPAPEPDSSTQH